MQTEEYKNIYKNESTHFFYTANHQIILSLIKQFIPEKKIKILDAGCGTGLLTKRLKKIGNVTGVDYSPEAIKFTKKRGLKVRRSSVNKLPFKNNSFDLITCIDVLCQLGVDDQQALGEFYRTLKPNGVVIIRVPANKWLKLTHDKHVKTRERYSESLLRERLLRAGFIIEKLSFVNLFLLPLVILSHYSQKIYPPKNTSSSVRKLHPYVNKMAHMCLVWEKYFLSTNNLPFGQGLIAVCQKPS